MIVISSRKSYTQNSIRPSAASPQQHGRPEERLTLTRLGWETATSKSSRLTPCSSFRGNCQCKASAPTQGKGSRESWESYQTLIRGNNSRPLIRRSTGTPRSAVAAVGILGQHSQRRAPVVGHVF